MGLRKVRHGRRLLNLQRQLARVNLLRVDERGFVPLSRTGAELLVEVFSQRHERGAIAMTANLPTDEWFVAFGSACLTGPLLEKAHPLCPNPGDELRELPAQAQQGE